MSSGLLAPRRSPAQSRKLSRLQLSLELLEEPPIGALCDDSLGCRLDHSGLVQSQGMEAQRVLWLGLAPSRVGQARQDLQTDLVARLEAALDEEAGDPLRVL